MGAVRRAERVVAVDVAVGSEFLRQLFLFLLERGFSRLEIIVGLAVLLLGLRLLFLVVAGVFQHDDVAGLHGRDFGVRLAAVRNEGHGPAEQFGKIFGNGFEAGVGGDALFIGSAEMTHQNQASALFEHVFDGGKSAFDSGVVLDDTLFDGHIEINAHDDAFAFEVDVAQCLLIHGKTPFLLL